MPALYYCYINNIQYLYSTSSTAKWNSINKIDAIEKYFTIELDDTGVKYKKKEGYSTDNDKYDGSYILYNGNRVKGSDKVIANAYYTLEVEKVITYKTVIANAIQGFNDIQSKINTNSGQLSQPSTTAPASITSIVGALKAASINIENPTAQSSTMTLSTTDTSSGIMCNISGTTVLSAGLVKPTNSTKTTTYYITSITVPESKILNSLIVNGTAKVKNTSNGIINWEGWNISVSKSDTEDILVFDPA